VRCLYVLHDVDVRQLDDLGAQWLDAMRRGDFSSAWHISDGVLEARRRAGPCFHLPRHQQWVWDGRPLDGQRVLVRCYHGLGDTLQFARFLPAVAHAARQVIVWAQPALIPLLRTLPGRYRFLPLHDGTPAAEYDVDVESMELAHVLRVTLETLPAYRVPYLDVRPAPPRDGSRFSVGLLARAGDWDARRSVPVGTMAQLATLPGVAAFSLQLGEPIPGLRDASSEKLCTLAMRLRALDLVITVDTMLAHLAGALGVPTWTLLPAEADWRWMTDRSDSPWYPTMRLFRQPRPGDWDAVLDAVRTALAQAAAV
jgi:hypothetical protein